MRQELTAISFQFNAATALAASFYLTGEIMKRNCQPDPPYSINEQDFIVQTAFHEAGHAAGIYLYNKQKQLPPVFFQITITSLECDKDSYLNSRSLVCDNYAAVLEGGHLIQGLPIALLESGNYYSAKDQDAYQTAFEADMINLLIGPLAEAKHVALRDDEPFNAQLVNINALYNYGGTSDLNKVYEYLENYIADRTRHQEKIAQLFNHAFEFINSPRYWRSIVRLADYIVNHKEKIISCEEAIAELDKD